LKQEEITKQKYPYVKQTKKEISTFVNEYGSMAYLKKCDIYANRKH